MFKRAVLLLLVLLVLTSTRASAHPADMYAQNQSITLARNGLQLNWKILPGPFLADAAWAAADTNGDGSISDAEARAWVAPFISDLSVSLDSRLLSPTIQAMHWPATVDVLRTGEDAVTVTLQMDWPLGLSGTHVIDIHNAHLEPNSLNWFSLTASDGLTFAPPSQNNGHLTFDLYSAGGHPAASAITSWTSGTPNLPDFTASLSSLASRLTNSAPSASNAPGANANSTLTPAGTTAATAALTGLVKNAELSPYFLLTAFLLSLALGSLHALTPGHGKALVGAYLVGSQGRPRDAVLLGGIVTITHTGSVLILGLVTLLASHYILPSLIVPWLELASGVLVILFGLNLLLLRVRHPVHDHDHAHPQDHAHPHEHDHAHAHPHEHPHAAAASAGSEYRVVGTWNKNEQSLAPAQAAVSTQPARIPARSLLALGVSGGLVPCPDAIAILLVAVALNRVPFGMLLIVAFSLGLAAVLIGIGIAMVRGVSAIQRSSLLARRDWLTRFGFYTPILSAIVVTGLGAGLTFNAWKSFTLSQALSAAVAHTPTTASPAASGLLYIASDSSGHDQLFMLTQPGGTPTQYTQEANGITGYSISPDGRTLLYSVFSPDGGSSIWSINSDGSGRRLVLDCPQAECNTPAWYPDGSKVAYERLENTTDSTTIPRFSVWWLDLQGGKTQPVFQDAAFPSTSPQFSPDGQWLSYISAASNTLVAFNLKDGRTLSVPLGSQSAIPETWSPDGSALLYGNRAQTGDPPPLHVKIYSLASGAITDLGAADNATDFYASWSPDGQWIAIDRSLPSGDPSGSSNQVWLVKPDGTQAHALLNEAGASYSGLSWSHDSRTLLYSRYTRDDSTNPAGRFDVCSVDLATGRVTVLVPGGDIAHFLP